MGTTVTKMTKIAKITRTEARKVWLRSTTKGSPDSYIRGTPLRELRAVRHSGRIRYFQVDSDRVQDIIERTHKIRPALKLTEALNFNEKNIVRARCGIECTNAAKAGRHQAKCLGCQKDKGTGTTVSTGTTVAIKVAGVTKVTQVPAGKSDQETCLSLAQECKDLGTKFEELAVALDQMETLQIVKQDLETKMQSIVQK